MTELWYPAPARVWTEALPLGNGRLGAMVFGEINRERLQINESTFFTGGPYTPVNADARAHLQQVRDLIFAGQYREAEDLAERTMMGRPYLQTSFQPIGDVWIGLHHQMNVREYRRSLDLDHGIAVTEYVAGGVRYRREAWISPVTGVLTYHITTDRPGAINIDIALSTPQPADVAEPASGRAQVRIAGKNRSEHGIPGQLRFVFAAEAKCAGGEVLAGSDTLRVVHCDAVTIRVDAATSFRRFDDVSGDPDADLDQRLSAVGSLAADDDRRQHIAEHRRLFAGFSIDLGSAGGEARPTHERIESYTRDRDAGLVALFVQYGRYLKVSSSRPGTQPSNLQGLWNDEIRPPWGSKYTTNINLEMNYWLPDPGGLGECFEPLIALVEDLTVTGAAIAREHYGAPGWVLHHNTDLWRAAAPVDGPRWGLWPTGGAWLGAQLWDHHQFDRRPELLQRIYPLLRGAAEFLLHVLTPHPQTGLLVTVPSLSPENQHPHGAALCAGPAMDNQLIRDLFAAVIEGSSELGIDPEFRTRVEAARAKLGPDQVGRSGQLQEWEEDWDLEVPEPEHRHVSHLYALYPSFQVDVETTPELAHAARRSLELRGDDATGWGLGWRLNLWARLRDQAKAMTILDRLLSPERSYPNLFDAHPPFQIDGNFGGAAGVIEMLVQSGLGRVLLLPALPPEWASGRVEGVGLRGGAVLDLRWEAGRPTEVRLAATVPFKAQLTFGRAVLPISIASGQEARFRFADGSFMAL